MSFLNTLKNRKKILGKNERNLKYIRPYNSVRAKEVADNKLLTKQILEANDIPTPKLIAKIENIKELNEFDWESMPNSFVMKPRQGLEGAGIEIFYNRDKQGRWIQGDGAKVSVNDLRMMALDIMDGKYSLHNQRDTVFFEERVKMHKVFKYYAYKGAPDIRIIVFNSVPIMSYLRLPTRESRGKGNLALGAVGVGIDLASGTTTTAVLGKDTIVEKIPGTNLSVSGLKIPNWDQILRIAIKAHEVTGLGFAAIDFLLDRDQGPQIIELNARPGLSIQIANRDGLRWRLKKAAGLKVSSPLKGIRIAKDLFGGQLEEQIERISGKQIISHIMPVEILDPNNKKIPTLALIDTSRRTTTINYRLAKKAGIVAPDEEFEETSISDITFNLAGEVINADCRVIGDKIRGYNMLVGRRDLGNFLVDIRRVSTGKEDKQKQELAIESGLQKPENIDNALAEISEQIFIVRNVRPTNQKEQRELFFKKKDHNPQFTYEPVNIDTDSLIYRLNSLSPDTSTNIGRLFRDKIDELKKEIYLIEAIGEDEKFAQRSENLYGIPSKKTFAEALGIVRKTDKTKPKKKTGKVLSNSEVEKRLNEHMKKIGIEAKVNFSKNGVSKASINKTQGILNINPNYKFTESKLLGTIAHEVDIHLARSYFGRQKDYKIYSYGTAEYLEIEEGLAILNKAKALKSQQPIRNAAIMYVSAYKNYTNSFVDTFKYLQEIGLSKKNAYKFALRTKKGLADTSQTGAFLKDMVYFTGYLKVKDMTDEKIENLIKSGKTSEVINL
ncbi:DUF1704 domain-containing protein [Candidatus Dojkabacteria bacterium]|nr:DUF1704 domain-containing protein [Candidatus Dojkabacteria bacterium]